MPEVEAIFFDLGGVTLSNGWDHASRVRAARQFGLDEKDFESRHETEADAFETGGMTLDAYLDRTVFYRDRGFTREQFKAFFFGQSADNPATRAVLDELTAGGRYFLATLNNESAELNEYRIRTFDLKRNFSVFLSSCYLGVRKPNGEIYRKALDIIQCAAGRCVFVDDRTENLEPAAQLGMGTIRFQDAAQLRADLVALGVQVGGSRPQAS